MLALLAFAPAAQAAQRYAAPGGAGEACAQAAPCGLATAVNKAVAGDEVILGSGAYTATESLNPPQSVFVHGDFSGPAAKIGSALPNYVIAVTAGDTLSHVSIDSSANNTAGIFCVQGTVDGVRVGATGSSPRAIEALNGCTVRDSLLLASGSGAVALFAESHIGGLTGYVRNVTAIAGGPESIGLKGAANPFLAIAYTVDIRNSILDGARTDVLTEARLSPESKPEAVTNVVVANSNFDRATPGPYTTITDAGGNQAVPPLFVDAAAGDYREAPGSPTIDAGAVDPLVGAADLLGAPRTVGAAPDIGAYEYVPPPPVLPPTGRVQTLALSPKAFRAAPSGGALLSAKGKAPVGATVAYSLSAAATVTFTVERRTVGRRVGKRCLKPTRANRDKKRCPLFKPVKSSFSVAGASGKNSFRFSGRIGGRALKPGRYRLVGSAGGASKTAPFTIVR